MEQFREMSPKYIVDEQGHPREVIIPWDAYIQILEILGLDLDTHAIDDLRRAQVDRVNNAQEAYIDLENLP